jgi:hypothetical protein
MASRIVAICLTLGLLGALYGDAEARPVLLSKRYETTKKTGLGLMLGTPVAVAGKHFFSNELAVDGGVGINVLRKRSGFHAHGDLLWHPFVAVEGNRFLAPLYFGGGMRLLVHDSITRIGLRIPVGLSFDFGEQPFDVFGEAALVLDAYVEEEGRGVADANVVVGARYFF